MNKILSLFPLLVLFLLAGCSFTQRDARWIAWPNDTGTEFGVYLFRNSFQLRDSIEKLNLRISADNRYKMYVNGQRVANGPARSDLKHWFYQTVDIAPYLHKGTNVVAIKVWNCAEMRTLAQHTLRTGLFVSAEESKYDFLSTGKGEWRSCKSDAYRPITFPYDIAGGYFVTGPMDSLVASKFPWGWKSTTFADTTWEVAVSLKKSDLPVNEEIDGFWNLVPRNIPAMEEVKEPSPQIIRIDGNTAAAGFPLEIPAHTKTTILVDQKYLTAGYPRLSVKRGENTRIKISYTEAFYEQRRIKNDRNKVDGKYIDACYDYYIADGKERTFEPLWMRTYRYILLEIETSDQALEISDLHTLRALYPFKKQAHFNTGDPLHDKIDEVGWRTLRLCSWETFMDCPYYEQLNYVEDTRMQALVAMYMTNDSKLVRNALWQFQNSVIEEGLTLSRYPSFPKQVIPPFSLFFVGMTHDYMMLRDDPDFVESLLPTVTSILGWFEKRVDDNGLLTNLKLDAELANPQKYEGKGPWANSMMAWNFADWSRVYTNPEDPALPVADSRGGFMQNGVPQGAFTGHTSVISLYFVYALQRASELFQEFNQPEKSAHYKQLADRISRAVMAACYHEQAGLIANTPKKKLFSQHANLFAVLTDALPQEKHQQVMKRLLEDKSLIQVSYGFRIYLFWALQKTGMGFDMLNHLQPWEFALSQNLTTFPEEDYRPRSDCHGWGAHPLFHFQSTICGIRPLKPGFKEVLVAPQTGDLKNIEAAMPHPNGGNISFSLEKNDLKTLYRITLPDGVPGVFMVGGERYVLAPGENKISIMN